jgi:SAM-dependent methyltransferase
MLRVARQRAPDALLAQADLNGRFPVPAGRFDTVVSSLVTEHLSSLGSLFREARSALRRGGLFVFSAFHPALVSAGVEANFSRRGPELRLGAARHTISDYLNHISESGFDEISQYERIANDELLSEIPALSKFEGVPVLFQVVARRATSQADAADVATLMGFRWW